MKLFKALTFAAVMIAVYSLAAGGTAVSVGVASTCGAFLSVAVQSAHKWVEPRLPYSFSLWRGISLSALLFFSISVLVGLNDDTSLRLLVAQLFFGLGAGALLAAFFSLEAL